jgi:acyl-coenzyme A synthetase/AMP-(fatty) acid ligase/thioesterase domain-containing protein/acyl carrier protein
VSSGATAGGGETIAEAFAAVVAARPDAPAVDLGGCQLSYREIDERSNALAHLLAAGCEDREKPVGILAATAPEFIVSILAAVKAGRFYIAVDPSWPAERIDHVVGTCGLTGIVGQTASIPRSLTLPLFDVEAANNRTPVSATPSALAFVIFTSGTTGEPRGIARSQSNILSGAAWNADALGMRPGDRVAWLSAPATGVASSEVFDALLSGATLCPIPVLGRPLNHVAAELRDRRVAIAKTVPSMFRHLAAVGSDDLRSGSIRMLRLSGEPAYRRDLGLFRAVFPSDARLQIALASSEGGPITCYTIEPGWAAAGDLLPTGMLGAFGIRLEGEDGRDALAGEAGELIVTSDRLTPGLWSDGAIRPLSSAGGALATGDLLRQGQDGLLYFAGRRDAMVKVRGHRVDLSEIEARILSDESVESVGVVADSGGDRDTRVVAFFTGAADPKLLRAQLARTVPTWMLPARLVKVDALPSLPTGKLDRVALTARASALWRDETDQAAYAEIDSLTRTLQRLWCKTLRVSTVRDDDDFFEQGGDSLLAAELAAQVEQELGRAFPLAAMTATTNGSASGPTSGRFTFARLVAIVRGGDASALDVLVPVNAAGNGPPLFCVTGEGGNVVRFLPLAEAIGSQQRFYALQSFGLDGSGPVFDTIEEIAAGFLKRIRSVQASGPYLLAGYSLGGSIAWEMARMLVADGEDVALLALLDAAAETRPVSGSRALLNRLLQLASSPRTELKPVSRAILGPYVRPVSRTVRKILRRERRAVPRSFLLVAESNRRARAAYQTPPYEGRAVLIRAMWGWRRGCVEQDLGWGPLALGGLEILDVPGDHDRFMRPPLVRHVAGHLRRCISEALAGSVWESSQR